MIRSGALRHRVTLQTVTVTSDGMQSGGSRSWADTATVWAAIWQLKGDEGFVAGKITGNITHRVRMRYRPDVTVTNEMRINFDGRYFKIRWVNNREERNRELDLLCEEVT